MQVYNIIDKFLRNKENLTLEELSKQIKKNEYKTRQELLNYLFLETEKLSYQTNPKKCTVPTFTGEIGLPLTIFTKIKIIRQQSKAGKENK